jgi:arylsulfatase A-like enzyme
MLGEIEFADAAIGQMVKALYDRGLLDSTAIIITAKHGQSPIDANRFFPIPGSSKTNGRLPSDAVSAFLPAVYTNRPRGHAVETGVPDACLSNASHSRVKRSRVRRGGEESLSVLAGYLPLARSK